MPGCLMIDLVEQRNVLLSMDGYISSEFFILVSIAKGIKSLPPETLFFLKAISLINFR